LKEERRVRLVQIGNRFRQTDRFLSQSRVATSNLIMAQKRIGVGIDLSAGSDYAIHWALANLAGNGDMVILLYVNSDVDYGEAQLWMKGGAPLVPLEDIGSSAVSTKYGIHFKAEIIEEVRLIAIQKDLTVVLKVYWGDARQKLCDAETDLQLHSLVVGSRGMGRLKRAILGSVSEHVVLNLACPVTVVKTPKQCLEMGSS